MLLHAALAALSQFQFYDVREDFTFMVPCNDYYRKMGVLEHSLLDWKSDCLLATFSFVMFGAEVAARARIAPKTRVVAKNHATWKKNSLVIHSTDI